MRSRPALAVFLLLAVSLLCSAALAQQQDCAPPVILPSAAEPNIFTQEQEVYLGDAVAEHIQRNYRVIEDPVVTDYVTRIGQRLVKNLPLNSLKFQFFLVDLPDANAFVIPGGRVYLSRKLVAAAQTEDELASVMAHELGHLVARHSAIDVTRKFKEVLGVTQVGDRRDIFEKYNQLIENLGRKPDAIKVRDREKGQIVADQAGLFALVTAGYEAAAMARFWDRITETKGKKGSWVSDLFGTTRPEEKRLREMLKVTETIPAACRQRLVAGQPEQFKQWQSQVISYSGLGRKEVLHGVIAKQQLNPPLQSEILHLRFSPDGRYLLAQDDAGINVLSREPFEPLFRIETTDDTYYAKFTPDSQEIVFHTDNLRVERWNITEQKQLDAKELVIRKGCLQTELSPDGRLLSCLSPDFELMLINTSNEQVVWRKKEFYAPDYWTYVWILQTLYGRGDDDGDLNISLIHTKFSPDGKYFAAGYHGRLYLGRTTTGDVAEAIDTGTLTRVSLPDAVKRLIAGGFVFLSDDRLAGVNRENVKKSAVVRFPSGEVLTELELWRPRMAAPTRGDYLLIRPVKDYALGVMDIKTRTITKVNERAALDILYPWFVAEMRNGQLGMYTFDKNEVVATSVLPSVTLARLRVGEVSRDMRWLALSTRSRGGVWELGKGKGALALRGFRGAYLDDGGFFFAEFPKYLEAERNVAKFNLSTGEVVPGPKIENQTAHQFGKYLFTIKSAKGSEKKSGDPDAEEEKAIANIDYRRNVIIEFLDVSTMQSLWTKAYPKEAPRVWIAPIHGTAALVWNVKTETARAEIKADATLTQRQSSMKEQEGDYFVNILDAANGNSLGKLLIETGKGSFRLSHVFAAGDWVVVSDTQNRVLIYSLKSGDLKGRVFGGYATIALTTNLLCVENEIGKLAIYDLNTMEKRDELVFSSGISLLRFSADGTRLFVLTTNQNVYVLDVTKALTAKKD